jgi:hypothetical protein
MCEFHCTGSYGVPILLYVVVDSFVLAVYVFQESWTPGAIQAGYLGSQMRDVWGLEWKKVSVQVW